MSEMQKKNRLYRRFFLVFTLAELTSNQAYIIHRSRYQASTEKIVYPKRCSGQMFPFLIREWEWNGLVAVTPWRAPVLKQAALPSMISILDRLAQVAASKAWLKGLTKWSSG